MTEESEPFCPMRDATPQRWVYHFTTRPTAVQKILPSQTIRLGQLEGVNDPKESRLESFRAQGRTGLASDTAQQFAVDVRDHFRRHVCVFCATTEPHSAEDLKQDHFLWQAGYKPTMWAHYGEGHQGVCLVFDKTKLESAISQQLGSLDHYFGTVNYGQRLFYTSYNIREQEIDAFDNDVRGLASSRFNKHRQELFFQKHLDWEPESEWRAVALNDKPEPLFVPYGDALAAILINMDFPREGKEEIKRFASDQDAGAHLLHWSVGQWGAYNLLEVGRLSADGVIDDQRTGRL